MSPLLLGALAVGGVGALVLLGKREPPDPTPTPQQLATAVGAFKGLSAAAMSTQLMKVGPLVFTAPAPAQPDAAYVYELLKMAARSPGGQGAAARQQALTEGQIALNAGDAPAIWSLVWRLTRQGLYGRGKAVGMKQQQRAAEINDVVTNLLAYELYWRESTGESFADDASDRIRNLIHRYQYIVSRILAGKVRVKYGNRLWSKALKGCQMVTTRGPSWGKFLTWSGMTIDGVKFAGLPAGLIVPGNITASGCDLDAILLKLAAQTAYAIGRLAVLEIDAAAYVGYDFGDLMAGISMVGQAFTESF